MLTYLYIVSTLVCVYGSGELTILHHPSSIVFKGHDVLNERDLKEVYSASLGFSVEHCSDWPGLYITDPFHLAEAVFTISIDGITNLEGGKGYRFPLKTTTLDVDTYDAMKERIEQRNPNGNSRIVEVDLSDSFDSISKYDFLQGIKPVKKVKGTYAYIKPNIEEDQIFLQEINLLDSITEKFNGGAIESDFESDYYMFRCLGLHAVSDLHGENSTATKEAKQILIEAIERLNDAVKKAYEGKVLFTVVTSDVSHTRRTRSATQNEANGKAETANLNLAKTYDANYPVIFNIILWFGVAMVFTLLAISIAIGSMDPGRDSIIYRMTSTRMKKDN